MRYSPSPHTTPPRQLPSSLSSPPAPAPLPDSAQLAGLLPTPVYFLLSSPPSPALLQVSPFLGCMPAGPQSEGMDRASPKHHLWNRAFPKCPLLPLTPCLTQGQELLHFRAKDCSSLMVQMWKRVPAAVSRGTTLTLTFNTTHLTGAGQKTRILARTHVWCTNSPEVTMMLGGERQRFRRLSKYCLLQS